MRLTLELFGLCFLLDYPSTLGGAAALFCASFQCSAFFWEASLDKSATDLDAWSFAVLFICAFIAINGMLTTLSGAIDSRVQSEPLKKCRPQLFWLVF